LSELKAIAFAVLVEWALDVEKRIAAAQAGAGVPENEQIHAIFILE